MAALGVGLSTPVLLYDDGSMVFAARAWWMLRALGYGPLHLLAGGLGAWEAAGGTPVAAPGEPAAVPVPAVPATWPLACDREQLVALQEQGAALVDCRDGARYRGEHEPIDPVAGHIPGASNLPWMSLTDPERGLRDPEALRAAWGDALEQERLVVYCGSGVSACVNLLSLAVLGRDDAWLYGGSWSDWCSYLE
jgi:thiosulfate/3-mercaptopyruvate sulfurtransferase